MSLINEFSSVPSHEAAQLVLDNLERNVDELVELGVKPRQKNNKLVFKYAGHLMADAVDQSEEDDETLEQRRLDGYVGGATIRRDATDDQIVSAEINYELPSRKNLEDEGALWRADSHITKIRRPAKIKEEEPRRLVLDSWLLPKTKLTEVFRDTTQDESIFNDLYDDMFTRTNPQWVPLAAQDFDHLVLGRPNELLDDRAHKKVLHVMTIFGMAVRNEVAWQQRQLSEVNV